MLRAYQPREPLVEGLTYHEGLNAVRIGGGVAGNVIPDECVVTVNYRFAPDRTAAEAEEHVRRAVRRLGGGRGRRRRPGPGPVWMSPRRPRS